MDKAQEKGLSGKSDICKNLIQHREWIRELEQKYQRQPGSVSLLAVSKTKPVEQIIEARGCKQISFGENYAQELEQKAMALQKNDIEWHFIGPLQSNKTKIIAAHADWVHSIERVKIATRLSAQRPEHLPDLQICLQVNIDKEETKAGVAISELPRLYDEISRLENIRIRGLMCIPKASSSVNKTRQRFAEVREALDMLNTRGYKLDTLSMGMSNDFEAAIAEGATIVRIGTAIFGQRP